MRLVNDELNDKNTTDKNTNLSKCIICPHCTKSIQIVNEYDTDDEVHESDESDENNSIDHQQEINDGVIELEPYQVEEETYEDIFNMTSNLMDYLYSDFLDIIMEYHYENKWKHILEITFDEINSIDESIFGTDNNTIIEYKDEIMELLIERMKDYLIERQNSHIPHMLYKSDEIESIGIKLERINKKNESIPEQRSEGWYNMRHNMLSASSLWKCLHTESARRQIIKEKCEPVKKFFSVNMDSPLHWGQKYEPLAQAYYEYKYNTQIKEYGCIQHDRYPFLGASPDGINIDTSSPLYGRMLEIKCIVNREITGIPKKEYWIQMQSQMECCDLDSCDFLECRFKEYDSYHAFVEDEGETYFLDKLGRMRGSYLCFVNEKGLPFYEYPLIHLKSKEEYEQWEKEMMDKHSKYTWLKTIRWYLEYVSCVTIKRNTEWFGRMVPKIREVWNEIEKTRETKAENVNGSPLPESGILPESSIHCETKPKAKSKTKHKPKVFLFDIDTSDL